MTYYNDGVPAADHNPSNDQPEMLSNTQGIAEAIAVDHVPFNSSNTGQHVKVTYNNIFSPGTPPAPVDPISIGYTANDLSTHPAQMFKNSQATFQLNTIRAFAVFQPSSSSQASITPGNSMNIATISSVVTGTALYTITFSGNPLFSGTNNSNAIVLFGFIQPSGGITLTSTTLTFTALVGRPMSFVILQA